MSRILPVTHERLQHIADRWRREQGKLEPRTPAAEAYRQCANDLELVLRDDVTLQPRRR